MQYYTLYTCAPEALW